MSILVFDTKGSIDIRSFTTFGINSKPNTNSPIGYFGTGLKYAIAVLCRLGGKVTVFIDGVEHEFYSKTTDFRGKSFEMLRMRKRKSLMNKWQYEELPFTTEFGKDWKAWQVFRELESNTRDENGSSYLIDDIKELDDCFAGRTLILVSDEDVVDAFNRKDEIFLPDHLEERESTDRVQIFNKPSNHLYYRGLRVADLPVPSMFTYNILSKIDLTEDRTIKYQWCIDSLLVSTIVASVDHNLIEDILTLDETKFYEGKIDFDTNSDIPSATFIATLGELKTKNKKVIPRASTYYDRYYGSSKTDDDVSITLKNSEWCEIEDILKDCVKIIKVRATEEAVDLVEKLIEEINSSVSREEYEDEVPY